MSHRIEFQESLYTEDEVRETLWLVTMELRAGLPKRERAGAERQIADLNAALAMLCGTAGAGP